MKRFSQILKHIALLTAMLLTGSNVWAAYGLTGSSCMGLNNSSFTAFTNNQYTFTATCSGSQWFKLYNGSISDANSCKLGSLSGGSTVSLGTSYATTQPGSTFQYNIEITKGATYTFTMSGSTLTITTSTASYTVTPSITGGTISPAAAQSVTSGSSVTFTVTPTASYVFTSASYSGTKSGDISQAGNSFTLTPTSTGTLSIVYSAPAASYTIAVSGTNCSFNETSKSIATGGSFDFVVTPNEGYKITAIAITGATADPVGSGKSYTTATTIKVSNPTANGTLTITTAPIETSGRKPTVRIGAKPELNADCGLTTTAYFAQRGCANITNVTLYYSNSRAFRIDGKNRTASKSKSVSNPSINTSTTVTLTSDEISKAVTPGETLYLRFTATNANGTSSYSDILPIKYECNKFITNNLAESFTACPGKHEFTWSDMFIYPSPTTWSVKNSSNADAKSEFSLLGDVMTWAPGTKTSGTYTYTFTGKTDGYDDATATLTITYTAPSGSVTGTITGLTTSPATSAETPTKPYTEITLNATGTTGNINEIDWTVTPATSEIYGESGNTMPATAKFKAQSRAANTTYTVTVTGYTATCASVSKSATIVVAPDITEKCD